MSEDTTVWFNPACSNCRNTRDLLGEQGVGVELFRYLDEKPSRGEIERVMGLLGIHDPRQMMREKEDAYRELDLASADRDGLIDAMAEHPILIQRPIVIRGDRAVIARPPERALELLGGATAPAGGGS